MGDRIGGVGVGGVGKVGVGRWRVGVVRGYGGTFDLCMHMIMLCLLQPVDTRKLTGLLV